MTDREALAAALDVAITHPGFHHYQTPLGYRFVWVDYTDDAERRLIPEPGDDPIWWCEAHESLVTDWKGQRATRCPRFHELVDSRLAPTLCRIVAVLDALGETP